MHLPNVPQAKAAYIERELFAKVKNQVDMLDREAQAWRSKFPKAVDRVNEELNAFRRSGDGRPVTVQDEVDVWRRWNPDFRFRPQDDVVTLK